MTGALIPATFLIRPSLITVEKSCAVVLYVFVSLDYYRRESAKIIAIFKESLPDGEIGRGGVAARPGPVIYLTD